MFTQLFEGGDGRSDEFFIPVYIVRGDFGNVGNGRVLGIFESKEVAIENAKGCGSFDCGGDGIVQDGWAIRAPDGKLYVISDPTNSFELNVMKKSEAKEIWEGPSSPAAGYRRVDVILKSTGDNKFRVLHIIRSLDESLGLLEAKRIIDSMPIMIAEDIFLSVAEELVEKLNSVGAAAEIREREY
jgi:ribosomal protein L7/L12